MINHEKSLENALLLEQSDSFLSWSIIVRFFCKPILRKTAQLWIFMDFRCIFIQNEKQTITGNQGSNSPRRIRLEF